MASVTDTVPSARHRALRLHAQERRRSRPNASKVAASARTSIAPSTPSPDTSSAAPGAQASTPVRPPVQPPGATLMRRVPVCAVTSTAEGASVNTPAPVFTIDAPTARFVGGMPRHA